MAPCEIYCKHQHGITEGDGDRWRREQANDRQVNVAFRSGQEQARTDDDGDVHRESDTYDAEAFEPDREVLVYSSAEEMLDKARYYIKHPDEGETIRRAGRRRALAEHSYHRRFEDLFSQIGIT